MSAKVLDKDAGGNYGIEFNMPWFIYLDFLHLTSEMFGTPPLSELAFSKGHYNPHFWYGPVIGTLRVAVDSTSGLQVSYDTFMKVAAAIYEEFIANGVDPDQARALLPLGSCVEFNTYICLEDLMSLKDAAVEVDNSDLKEVVKSAETAIKNFETQDKTA